MAIDPSKRTYKNWPEVGEELNAGFMYFNSSKIKSRFDYWWFKKINEFKHIAYFDELIFSAICRDLDGKILDENYNKSWEIENNEQLFDSYTNKETKILHFHGERKNQLKNFINFIIKQ